MIKAYFDGCCEPINPGGTAAYGAVIFRDDEKLWVGHAVIPAKKTTSNNLAEYSGLLAILEQLMTMDLPPDEDIRIYGDSRLVVNQMSGRWRIKNGFYVPVAKECLKLIRHFKYITFWWIPREENDVADELSKSDLKKEGVKFRIQPE